MGKREREEEAKKLAQEEEEEAKILAEEALRLQKQKEEEDLKRKEEEAAKKEEEDRLDKEKADRIAKEAELQRQEAAKKEEDRLDKEKKQKEEEAKALKVIKKFVKSKVIKKNISALTPSYVPVELSQVANETLIEFNDLKNNKLSIKL